MQVSLVPLAGHREHGRVAVAGDFVPPRLGPIVAALAREQQDLNEDAKTASLRSRRPHRPHFVLRKDPLAHEHLSGEAYRLVAQARRRRDPDPSQVVLGSVVHHTTYGVQRMASGKLAALFADAVEPIENVLATNQGGGLVAEDAVAAGFPLCAPFGLALLE